MADAEQSVELKRAKNPVRLERAGGVATILIDNPPVNALSAAVRQGIFISLEAAEADENTDAIIIAAIGRTFPAGADITEFGKAPQQPALGRLCDRIEACTKPVLAALHGTVLGGGLEVAMAAHYRIADPNTKLGLPEVKLGILPGAGGTQRAPRLVGVADAYQMIQTGAPITARKAQEIGLIDVVDDDPRGAARALAESGMEVRRTRDDRSCLSHAAPDLALLKELRAGLDRTPGPMPAKVRIVDCIEAALLLPFDAGCIRERDAFEECVVSRDSLGLRHVFLSERRAAKFPELDGVSTRPPGSVSVIGGGLMGAGIALACLNAGLKTTVVEQGEEGVTSALDRIGMGLQKAISKGKLSEADGERALTQLNLTTRFGEIAQSDLVIESITENLDAKRDVLAEVGRIAKPGAVLATNSSYLDPETLAEATGRAEDFVGIHFFAPAQIMPLVEIAIGKKSSTDAVGTAHAFAKKLRKIPVRSAATPAMIVNRILAHFRLVADAMLEDGATPQQIDAAMREFGFPLGPYEVLDRSGLDISFVMRRQQVRRDDRRYVDIGDRMVEQGWLGRKSGRGYYVHDADQAHPNPAAVALIEQVRADKGITPRTFTKREIRDRILLAMMNEGARLLEDGVATRPSDIDVCLVRGLGYPERRGGPMHDADQTTVFEIARRIEQFAGEDPTLWQVSALITRLARERGKFSDLN